MPMYDFKCPNGHTFDALAKEGEIVACRVCEAPAKPQIGAPAFALKGSGFYDGGRKVAGKRKTQT